jgi:hypothetical protein
MCIFFKKCIFMEWTAEKRAMFTQMMCCTDTLHVRINPTVTRAYSITQLTSLLCANFNFSMKWEKFVIPSSDARARCHKMLEQADLQEDNIYFKHLMQGKSKFNDEIDNDQIEFLEFYVRHAQVNWKFACNAFDCNQPVRYRCSKCRVARYCTKKCQVSDWKLTHKYSCAELVGWDVTVNAKTEKSVMQ